MTTAETNYRRRSSWRARPGYYEHVKPCWYVHVALKLDRDKLKHIAMGPVTWTRARELADAWEAEFGPGTARCSDRVPQRFRPASIV